jgi:hypothetical protein
MKQPLPQVLSLMVVVSLCVLASPGPAPAQGQKAAEASDAFFKSGKVLNLKIVVEGKDLQDLMANPRKYVTATLSDNDQAVYKDIGLHLKGAAGSFQHFGGKPGLTLNMDKFVKKQLFHGMDKFHLANSVQDASYVAELLCGELFRAAGVPAARVGHALVTLNGKSKGLYYLKEGYDGHFLKKYFGSDEGNLYDGGFLKDLNQPLQLLSNKNDVKDQSDLKKLWTAAGEKDLKLRFARMERVLDMDRFLSYLALEVITWDWDGYPMNRNNYRIYHDPKKDKLIFIPSGMDQMFSNTGGPILPNFQGVVARAVLETPEGRARYLARLDEIMKTVFHVGKIHQRLDELQAIVQPALATVHPQAGRDYPAHIKNLKNAVAQREKSVLSQLQKMKN